MSKLVKLNVTMTKDSSEWWEETIRRCKEAENHPEKLIDADAFFKKLRKSLKEDTRDDDMIIDLTAGK